jgi:hypothetical protein
MNQVGEAQAKLDEYGIDALCEALLTGTSQAAIAGASGVSQSALVRWIAADPERSARVREARITAARHFDERAEQVLKDAADPFELAKARELASHYRWKASKSNPREYGDKIEIDQKTTITDLTEEQLDAKLARLLAAG